MPEVIGIRFKPCGKIYDFEKNGIEADEGDLVVVDSEFGLSIGSVVIGPHQIESPVRELRKIIRLATDEDINQKKDNEDFEKEAKLFCIERIMARGIPMKMVCTEVTLDKKRVVFYFTADGRIDFRELVKDLAAKFRTRIEMRQIGVRDKAKLVGGLGPCGKEFCCRVFLTSFEPISIKMAKQQELVLNTGKLSGVCGRLMCCLGYEYDDAPPGAFADSGEDALQSNVEEEVLEAVVSVPEALPPSHSSINDGILSQPEVRQHDKPGQGQKPDDSRRHKRRRRRRGKFKKK